MKISLEKQQKAELGYAEQRLAALEKQLESIFERVARQMTVFHDKVKEGITPVQMTVYAIGFRALQDSVERQKEKIAVAQAEKQRIQKKLVELMRERKMLETFYEKQLEEYKKEAQLEESKAIDDFLSNQIQRNGGGRT